jgi:WD40 repeat protein
MQQAIDARRAQRAPSSSSSKKKKKKTRQMTLRRIIGTTSQRNAALSSITTTTTTRGTDGTAVVLSAYAAGAAVVIYNAASDQQVAYLTTPASRPISCLAFSPDGKYLAAGERGQHAAVVVWEMGTQRVVAEMRGHKSGVSSLAWAHSLSHIASAGENDDGELKIWSWRSGALACSGRVSSRICCVSAQADGSFVTSGHRHLKFWSMRRPPSASSAGSAPQHQHPLRLEGHSAVLGVERNSTYVGAASVASFEAAVLAEIYLCNVCSCQEILRRHGRG